MRKELKPASVQAGLIRPIYEREELIRRCFGEGENRKSDQRIFEPLRTIGLYSEGLDGVSLFLWLTNNLRWDWH